MAAEIELLIRGKTDVDRAFATLQTGLDKSTAGVEKFNQQAANSAKTTASFADAVGRTSTTLARSASAFGLPAEALRTLDDVADVAELGLNNLTKSAAGFNAASLGAAGAGLAVGTAIGSWLNTFPAVQKAADSLIHTVFRLTQSQEELDKQANAMSGLKEFQEQMKASNEGAIKKQIEGLLAMGVSVKDLQQRYKDAGPAIQGMLKGMEERTTAVKKAAEAATEAAKKHAEAIDKLQASLSDVGKFETNAKILSELDEVISRMGGSTVLTAKEVERFAEAAKKAGKQGEEWAKSLREATGHVEALVPPTISLGNILDKLQEDTIPQVTQELDAMNAEMAKIGGVIEVPEIPLPKPPDLKKWSTVLKADFKTALQDLPDVILKAVQGGGDVGKAIGAHLGASVGQSLATSLGKKVGDTLGGVLNTILPGLGSVIGSFAGMLAGKIGGLIGNLFGGKEREVDKLRDAFIASAGGLEALRAKAASAGVSLDALFAAKDSRKGLQAAIEQVTKGLAGWEESHEALQQAVERYGFTIEELGPKFRQQELDKQAAQLLQDYELLIASGIENVTVLERMAPAMNEYVNTVIAAGTAIPENMRPALQKMAEMGLLTDEAGNKMENLDGLQFTESLTEGLSRAIDAINRLVAALGGIPGSVPPIHVPIIEHRSGGGGGGGDGDGGGVTEELGHGGVVLPFMPRAANGIVAAAAGGTPVLVGEGGQSELVAPVRALADQIGAAAARAAMSTAGGQVVHVHVMLEGRELGSAIVDMNRRGALPIRDASIVR